MKLTIGMAHHMDYSGAYFTIRHIRQTNRRLRDFEFVVVDNAPDTQHGRDLKGFIEHSCSVGTAGAKYVAMPELGGTTQPRNRVFAEATGDVVLCVDCHIDLEPFAADRLLEYFEANPGSSDLVQGPLLNDHDGVYATHFQDVWNDEMWGIWGLDPRALADGPTESLPVIERIEKTKDLQPFEIPAMGLGLFACRREAWLAFNEHFRGFGGEEWYIHEKYRKAGGRCLCLPWLRWGHRFGRPDGIGYTLTMDNKVRNYILGHQELGLSLDRVYEHFVASGRYPRDKWEWLVADPVNHLPDQVGPPQTMRRQGQAQAVANPQAAADSRVIDASRPQPPDGADLDGVFEWCKAIERDLNRHLPVLKEWASKCESVTEFSERRESTVGLLAGRPKKLVSYNKENDLLISSQGALHRVAAADPAIEFFQTIVGDSLEVPAIEETDLLFIDTQHHAERLTAELQKHGPRVRRAIIVHDTHLYGETGDNGGPGLNHALKEWVTNNPEWFVAYFTSNQFGLTVLSKHPDDRPSQPVHAWPPGQGPGTELKKILAAADINPGPSCDCNAKALQMDLWGPDECDRQFEVIVGWIRDGEERWGWKGKLGAAFKLAMKDPLLALSLLPYVNDPIPGLIKASIRRARKQEAKAA